MPTRLSVHTYSSGEDAAAGTAPVITVSENFSRVMDLVIPLQQPASALEARQRLTLTEHYTNQPLWINPQAVVMIQGLPDE